ncbi:MAG: hypothetical protein DLM53_09205 [Candidatus Eremiobacter antarcticus]|nr:MAG: hypothetical protein DLM53_09205 [Candidatus Eremiobacter sp. RRmetagenome_bin22]
MWLGLAASGFVSRLEGRAVDEQSFSVGQLAGPGTYQCESCGKVTVEHALSFEIEPCSCGNVTFRRID